MNQLLTVMEEYVFDVCGLNNSQGFSPVCFLNAVEK